MGFIQVKIKIEESGNLRPSIVERNRTKEEYMKFIFAILTKLFLVANFVFDKSCKTTTTQTFHLFLMKSMLNINQHRFGTFFNKTIKEVICSTLGDEVATNPKDFRNTKWKIRQIGTLQAPSSIDINLLHNITTMYQLFQFVVKTEASNTEVKTEPQTEDTIN